MNNKTKVLLLTLCAVAVVAAAAFGTLAYLTDTEAATNTFAVGRVGLTLDEAKVNTDGTPVEGDDRVQKNEYHLIPGHTYIKDPTVTILKNSEETYVRMLVEVKSIDQLMRALPQAETIIGEDGTTSRVVFPENQKYYSEDDVFLLQMLCNGWEASNWACVGYDSGIYEFRYVGSDHQGSKVGTVKKTDADIKLAPLFDSITVPGEIDNDHLANLRGIEINVTAHAIQAAGFDDANAAWAAFETQNP